MNNERKRYDEKFQEVLGQLFNTARGAKTADYGETWKRLGYKEFMLSYSSRKDD